MVYLKFVQIPALTQRRRAYKRVRRIGVAFSVRKVERAFVPRGTSVFVCAFCNMAAYIVSINYIVFFVHFLLMKPYLLVFYAIHSRTCSIVFRFS